MTVLYEVMDSDNQVIYSIDVTQQSYEQRKQRLIELQNAYPTNEIYQHEHYTDRPCSRKELT